MDTKLATGDHIYIVEHDFSEHVNGLTGRKVIVVIKGKTAPRRVVEDILHDTLNIDYIKRVVHYNGNLGKYRNNMVFADEWTLDGSNTFPARNLKEYEEHFDNLFEEYFTHNYPMPLIIAEWDDDNNTTNVVLRESNAESGTKTFLNLISEYINGIKHAQVAKDTEELIKKIKNLDKEELTKIMVALVDKEN